MKKTFWGDYNQTAFPRLEKDISCRHLIVGGGIAGLFTAYFLLEKGEKDIVIVEKFTIGSGSTGHSAGMLVMESEQATWTEIAQKYGYKNAQKYADGQRYIFSTIKKVIAANSLDCDLREEPLILLSNNKTGDTKLIADFVTRKKIGLKTKLRQNQEVQKIFNAQGFSFAEITEKNLSVNPLKFARSLAGVLRNRGVLIYEQSEVLEHTNKKALLPNCSIAFETMTTCLGTYTKRSDVSTYLTTIAITNKLSKATLSLLKANDKDMFIDNEKRSFHYGRFTVDNRMLIGYGDVLKKDRPRDEDVHIPHQTNIERFIKKTFPNLDIRVDTIWSARFALSQKNLPIVVCNKNTFIIDGAGTQIDSALCADYITSKILKQKHPLDTLFKK